MWPQILLHSNLVNLMRKRTKRSDAGTSANPLPHASSSCGVDAEMRIAQLKEQEGSCGRKKPDRARSRAGSLLNQADERSKRTLFYSSKMVAESSEVALDMIAQIMAKAIVSNADHGIHAVLNFNPHTLEVVQTIHGEEATVRQLYANVERDPRHVITKKGVFTSAELSTATSGTGAESRMELNLCEGFSTAGLDGNSEPEKSEEEDLFRYVPFACMWVCMWVLPHPMRTILTRLVPSCSVAPPEVSQLTPQTSTPHYTTRPSPLPRLTYASNMISRDKTEVGQVSE